MSYHVAVTRVGTGRAETNRELEPSATRRADTLHNMSSTKLKLYIWPGAWGLPSIDAQSLAAALYVQLAAPGKFALVESADADSAPLGR